MSLIQVSKKVGPTINGKKPLLSATTVQKRQLLNIIAKKWRSLLRLHFKLEGGVVDGRVIPWAELSQAYLQKKRKKQLLPGILEASQPTLAERYSRSVGILPSSFSIYIAYPLLISGKSKTNDQATAAVHQLGGISEFGRPIKRRRIILKDFKKIARQETVEYFKNNV